MNLYYTKKGQGLNLTMNFELFSIISLFFEFLNLQKKIVPNPPRYYNI
jgi:hypothetical protein